MNEIYNQCKRCVMDNSSDKHITFNEEGFCNYCDDAIKIKDKIYFPNEFGNKKIDSMVKEIRQKNRSNKYDCIMGISGGLDSSYLLYLGSVKWGLKILAVHVNDGFDERVAKENIIKLCNACNVNLITIEPDKNQFNDLTRSYILAGVPNIAIPQDNIIFASIFREAKKYNIKSFLAGGNFALESILEKDYIFNAYDVRNIKDIHKKYGRIGIKSLPLLSDFRKFINKKLGRIVTYYPLNYIDYNRNKAIDELKTFCDFQYYGSKHLENKLTKFIQLNWYFNKFGVDKRKSHLSSMIVSGQLTRDEAIKILDEPLYDEKTMNEDTSIILKSLDISNVEFECIMRSPNKNHNDFKVSNIMDRINKLSRVFKRTKK